jgi:XTP/dITP diphosphohydrolase
MGMKLLLATQNKGKQKEWCELLNSLDITLVTPEDLGLSINVAETGETYLENAMLKAKTFAQASGLTSLADDSGLEVDALDGAPGVKSARYRLGTDTVRFRALLEALSGVPPDQRQARFRCVAALVLSGGDEFWTEGVCEGSIVMAPAGAYGFGYDPVFYVAEYGQTMAQLSREVKNKISHRARAASKMKEILGRVLNL